MGGAAGRIVACVWPDECEVAPDVALPSLPPSRLAALLVLRPRLVPAFAPAPADIE